MSADNKYVVHLLHDDHRSKIGAKAPLAVLYEGDNMHRGCGSGEAFRPRKGGGPGGLKPYKK